MSYPPRKMLLAALAVVLTALPASAAVDADRVEAAERLSARALDTLEGILGPGRAKVHVEVDGERYDLRTELELLSPLPSAPEPAPKEPGSTGPQMRAVELPGYTRPEDRYKNRLSGAPG